MNPEECAFCAVEVVWFNNYDGVDGYSHGEGARERWVWGAFSFSGWVLNREFDELDGHGQEPFFGDLETMGHLEWGSGGPLSVPVQRSPQRPIIRRGASARGFEPPPGPRLSVLYGPAMAAVDDTPEGAIGAEDDQSVRLPLSNPSQLLRKPKQFKCAHVAIHPKGGMILGAEDQITEGGNAVFVHVG